MKTKSISLFLMGAILASPLLFIGCAGNHPVAAGAAGAAAYNQYDENQKKDNLQDAADNREKRDR